MPTLLQIWALLLVATAPLAAQLREDFDGVLPPDLPPGWSSSAARATSDFVTTTSLPASSPNCVLGTNATVAQTLTSPALDLRGLVLRALLFQTRRSASFLAALLVELSTDGGANFLVCDTLGPGTEPGSYARHRLVVSLPGAESLRIRWRVIADRSGSSGTLRIDDVELEADALYDLAACALSFEPTLPGAPLAARVKIANAGLLAVPHGEVHLALDADGDSLLASGEWFKEQFVPPPPGESLWVSLETGGAPSHRARARAEVHAPDDRIGGNNAVEALFRPGVPPGTVVFNEIMYAPLAGDPEYLELAVGTSAAGSLGGWELRWAATGAAETSALLLPEAAAQKDEFLIVASAPLPERWSRSEAGLLITPRLVLRNDGGVLVLRDPSGMTADSLAYGPQWHTPSVVETRGRSLEKLLPELPSADGRNWATCTEPAGGTPGRHNSVRLSPSPTHAMLACSPNPFSPDGDGVDDWTLIRYSFADAVQTVDLSIYDARGRIVRHLATRELGGLSGTLVWDGRDDTAEAVRMGIYVVVIRAVDEQAGEILTARAAVVVARALR